MTDEKQLNPAVVIELQTHHVLAAASWWEGLRKLEDAVQLHIRR